MSKTSGLPTSVSIADSSGTPRVISGDITSIDISTPRGTQDITGLDKSAVERLLLLADGKVTVNGVLNTAANMSHAVFSTVPTTSVARAVVIGYPGATLTLTCMFTDYAVKRSNKGELTFSSPGELSNGIAPAWS